MEEILSIADAAKSLGVSDRTVRNWIKSRTLTASASEGVPWSEIVRLIKQNREQALARLPYTAASYGRIVFTTLWPTVDHETRNERGGITIDRRPSTDAAHALEVRGQLLAGPAADVFGHASIYAAARPLDEGCRWCAARAIADRLRALPPVDKPEYRALFGQDPCETDRHVFAARDQREIQARREQAVKAEAGKSLRLAALRLAEIKAGAPYRLNAVGPTAFDCAGLVQWAYAQAGGVDVPRTAPALLASGARVALSDAEPGDLLFQSGAPNHLGIFAGDGLVVHAADGVGVTVSPVTANRWDTALRLGVSS